MNKKHKPLTYEYLHEILEYDPLTGELRNKINRGRAKAGFVHRAKNSNGYIVISLNGKLRLIQNIIWFMMTGAWADLTIDHENTIRDDNRWTNLREATESQNMANRKVSRQNRVGVKGVIKRGKRFYAHIVIAGQFVHLGTYATAEEASAAYLEAAQYVHGEFARA